MNITLFMQHSLLLRAGTQLPNIAGKVSKVSQAGRFGGRALFPASFGIAPGSLEEMESLTVGGLGQKQHKKGFYPLKSLQKGATCSPPASLQVSLSQDPLPATMVHVSAWDWDYSIVSETVVGKGIILDLEVPQMALLPTS